MAPRIVDLRTDRPCDYAAIAAEVEKRRKATDHGWRQVAEEVALEVNADHAESIVRNLNRWRSKVRRQPPKPSLLAPGFGVLYARLELLIDQMAEEAKNLPRVERICAALADKAAVIREILERRLEELEAIEDAQAPRVVDPIFERLADLDSFFDPEAILEADRDRVLLMIQRLGHLQREIDLHRPTHSWRDP